MGDVCKETLAHFGKTFQGQVVAAVYALYEVEHHQCTNQYYYNDYEDFDGMNIGVLASCDQLDALDDYAAAHHFSFEKQYFGNTAQLEKALEDNTVDAIYATSVSHPSEKKILASLPSFPLYFVTFKGNPIMEDLKEAFDDTDTYIYNIGDSVRARRIMEGTMEGRAILNVLENQGYLTLKPLE